MKLVLRVGISIVLPFLELRSLQSKLHVRSIFCLIKFGGDEFFVNCCFHRGLILLSGSEISALFIANKVFLKLSIVSNSLLLCEYSTVFFLLTGILKDLGRCFPRLLLALVTSIIFHCFAILDAISEMQILCLFLRSDVLFLLSLLSKEVSCPIVTIGQAHGPIRLHLVPERPFELFLGHLAVQTELFV